MAFLIMYILACFWHLPPSFVGHDARIAPSTPCEIFPKTITKYTLTFFKSHLTLQSYAKNFKYRYSYLMDMMSQSTISHRRCRYSALLF